jgi:hypothetical protein
MLPLEDIPNHILQIQSPEVVLQEVTVRFFDARSRTQQVFPPILFHHVAARMIQWSQISLSVKQRKTFEYSKDFVQVHFGPDRVSWYSCCCPTTKKDKYIDSIHKISLEFMPVCNSPSQIHAVFEEVGFMTLLLLVYNGCVGRVVQKGSRN